MFRSCLALAGLLAVTAGIAYAAQHTVGQKDRLFTPGTLTVKSGDPVTFVNDDNVTHHVYSSSKGFEFNLKTMKPGDSRIHTFAAKGKAEVRCGLHPGMRLIVTVQ